MSRGGKLDQIEFDSVLVTAADLYSGEVDKQKCIFVPKVSCL